MSSIALVLTSRFPSEKAYAVTTLETARAAESLGISVQIFAPSDSAGGQVANLTKIGNKLIRRLSPLLGRVPAKLDACVFFLRRILIAAEFKRILRASDCLGVIVWTRDPIVAVIVINKTRVFLEIHNTPSRIDSLICKFLDKKMKFSVGTLTINHRDQLRKYFPSAEIAILPMAVSDSFFLLDRHEHGREIVGYVGKGWSSGEDNKVYELIDSAKLVDTEVKNLIQWKFLGLESSYKSSMESMVRGHKWEMSQFEFINHVSHEEVSNYLGDMTIGLIPYHDSAYNRQRFPIKTLEYAAAGVTILATNTPGNLSILSSDFCYFYNPDDATSLAKAILSILGDHKNRHLKRENARNWAQTHSYNARVEIVLNSFGNTKERGPN